MLSRLAGKRLPHNAAHLHQVRNVSSSPEHHSKVTAWPFAIDKTTAIRKMAPYASALSLFKGIVGSLGAQILPNAFTPIQPTEIKAVYFPGWFIDAELGAEMIDGEEKKPISIISTTGYMPGCSFDWISKRNFRPVGFLDGPFPQPFTSEMVRQHGEEVTCLPYTSSPLPLFDQLQSLSYSDAKITDEIRINPSSIETRFVAAYPVLIPIYLARYELQLFDNEKPMQTVMACEAYRPDGFTHIDIDAQDLDQRLERLESRTGGGALTRVRSLLDFARSIDNPRVGGPRNRTLRESDTYFAVPRVMTPLRNTLVANELGRRYTQLMESAEADAIVRNDEGMADLEDVRVRGFTLDDATAHWAWMLLTRDAAELKGLLDVFDSASAVTATKLSISASGVKRDTDFNIVEDTQKRMNAILERKRTTQPEWWKEWLERSADRKSVV